jgi:hypothetical protein
MRFLGLFAIFLCSFTLSLSIYPGLLNGFAVYIAIASLWFILMSWLAVSTFHAWWHQHTIRPMIVVFLIIALTYGLLKFYIPRRIAFALSQPAFEQWLYHVQFENRSFPPSTNYRSGHGQGLVARPEITPEGQGLQTKLGLYQVEEYIMGDRNDHYFRTYSHGAGLGPDTVSYGFAYQPHPQQTPFGSAGYRLYPLAAQWYWFTTSNDWW